MKNKHIAMWSCPRSRTTAITRAFEQLDGCAVFDTPFFGAYLRFAETRVDQFDRPEIDAAWEADPEKVITQMTGDLPEGASFSFQRHISRTVLPQFGRDWLKSLNNFFLIRHPQEIILSYQNVLERYNIANQYQLTMHDIGIDVLYHLFLDVEAIWGQTPLVIHSDDLAKNPALVLAFLCDKLGVDFSEKMLTWENALKNSTLAGSSVTSASKTWAKTWYTTIHNSSGFLPYEKKEEPLHDELRPLLEACMPFYEKLFEHRVIFS